MLLTMQAFHTRLFSEHSLDAYLAAVARLTQSRRAQTVVLHHDLHTS